MTANFAKQRLEEMIQEAERERRFNRSVAVKVNLVTNAINAIRFAFARTARHQPQVPASVARQTTATAR
jgi:hypothetical protein